MNHYDAFQIRARHILGQPVSAEVLAEANAFVERQRRPAHERSAPVPAPKPEPRFISNSAPPMSALCVCGARYGMHRVNDFCCPNGQWMCGNGQPQWLKSKWKRA